MDTTLNADQLNLLKFCTKHGIAGAFFSESEIDEISNFFGLIKRYYAIVKIKKDNM